jgi:hypothetical protein
MYCKGIIEISSKDSNNPGDTPANYKISLINSPNSQHVWLDNISIPVTWNNVYFPRNTISYTVDGIPFIYSISPDYYSIFYLCQLISAGLTAQSGVNITFSNSNVPSPNDRCYISCQLGHTYSFSINSTIANILGFPTNTLINVNPAIGYTGQYHPRNESFERIYIYLDGAQIDHSYTDLVSRSHLIAIMSTNDTIRGSNILYRDFLSKYYGSIKVFNTFRVCIQNDYNDYLDFNGGNTYISINYS